FEIGSTTNACSGNSISPPDLRSLWRAPPDPTDFGHLQNFQRLRAPLRARLRSPRATLAETARIRHLIEINRALRRTSALSVRRDQSSAEQTRHGSTVLLYRSEFLDRVAGAGSE